MDSAAGAEDEEEVVAVLDRDSWEDRTQEVELALVHFHTDWCRHCRSPAIHCKVASQIFDICLLPEL